MSKVYTKRIEYILEGNLLEKMQNDHFVVLFPYCRCTSHILLCSLLGPGISLCRKSKTNIKRKTNYEIGWFHN